MPTPRAGYFLADGSKVPGTTTIIGRFKESGGLMQWAFAQGKAGKSRLYEEAEKAADIGTCVHAMIEMSIKGAHDTEITYYVLKTLTENDAVDRAWSAYHAYKKWAAGFGVQVLEQELQLVSEQYRYGGTLDAIALVGNSLALLDWKSSNAIYTDYLVQLAAYGNLWNEKFPQKRLTGGYHLLRFSKENADFAHHHYDNLDEAWRQFVLFREAYDIDKILKKRAA